MGFLDNLLNGQSFEKGLDGLKNCMEKLSGDGLANKIDELAENLESRAKKVKSEVAEKGNEKKYSNKPRPGYVVNSKGKKYRSLQKAIDEAKDGERLTITGDIHEAVKISFKSISLIGTGENKEEWPIIWFEGDKKNLKKGEKYGVVQAFSQGLHRVTLENLRIQGCSRDSAKYEVLKGHKPVSYLLELHGFGFVLKNLYIANATKSGIDYEPAPEYKKKVWWVTPEPLPELPNDCSLEELKARQNYLEKYGTLKTSTKLVRKAMLEMDNVEIENVGDNRMEVYNLDAKISRLCIHDVMKDGLLIYFKWKNDVDDFVMYENCSFYNSGKSNVTIKGTKAGFTNCKFWGAKADSVFMEKGYDSWGGGLLNAAAAKFIDCEIRDNGGYDVNMDHEECEAYFTNCKFSGGVTDGTGIDFNKGKAIFN